MMTSLIFRCALYKAIIVVVIGVSCLSVRAEDFEGRLEALLAQYAAVERVSMVAETESVIVDSLILDDPQAPTRYPTSTFEYTAEGNKYNIVSLWSTESNRYRYAYNGEHAQILDVSTRQLMIWKEDNDSMAGVNPNPFFVPVQFLDETATNKHAMSIKLGRVKNAAVGQSVIGGAKWKHQDGKHLAIVGAAPLFDDQTFFEVTFGEKERVIPYHIRRMNDAGKILQVWVLEDPVTIKGGRAFTYAGTIKRVIYKNDAVYVSDTTRITQCEINGYVDGRVFTIDFNLADEVVDGDTKTSIEPPVEDRLVGKTGKLGTRDYGLSARNVAMILGVVIIVLGLWLVLRRGKAR